MIPTAKTHGGLDILSDMPHVVQRCIAGLALAALCLAGGCVPMSGPGRSLPLDSSLLAVDVRFPAPLARDHSLVEVFFVEGAFPGATESLPELIPASFVKKSRAYLLDPEPGSYTVVAVGSNIAPNWNRHSVADGVMRTVVNDDPGHVVVFPAELVEQTRTEVRAGEVAFVGELRVRRGLRINADVVAQDDLQPRIAERIRPGVTSADGFGGWVSMTWLPDLEHTRLIRDPMVRRSFFDGALDDLAPSPWARFVEGSAPRAIAEARAAERERARPLNPSPLKRRTMPAPPPTNDAPEPESESASEPATESASGSATGSASEPVPVREVERPTLPGVAPDSPLAQIAIGMHHGDVNRILGEPEERNDRLTASAWIPFNTGRGARLVDWIYPGLGRVTFSVETGTLRVYEVVPESGGAR